jgi:hypothetical protein
MHQPDFQALFFKTFHGSDRRVDFRVRCDSNLHHDIQFLSSLLHDARILSVSRQDDSGRMDIVLDRDRWELFPPSATGDDAELVSIASTLQIDPVLQFDSRLLDGAPSDGLDGSWIEFIEVERIVPERKETIRLRILCHNRNQDRVIVAIDIDEFPKLFQLVDSSQGTTSY